MHGHRSIPRWGYGIMTLCVVVVLVVPFFVHAGAADPTTLLKEIGKVIFDTGDGTPPNLTDVIGKLIKWVLGFVGTIFFALMLYAGFLWMTAQGETEKVDKARSILIQATIGVVIIALAYAITFAVTTGVQEALN